MKFKTETRPQRSCSPRPWLRNDGQRDQTGRPLLPVFDAAMITARCDGELANVRQQQKAIEARKGAGTIFAELNALSIRLPICLSVTCCRTSRPTGHPRRGADLPEKVLPSRPSCTRAPRFPAREGVKPKTDDTVYQQDCSRNSRMRCDAAAEKRKRAKEIIDELER